MMTIHHFSWIRRFVLLTMAASMCGCTADAGAPRLRIGSLPFPGIFSFYHAADPDDLGVHCAGSPLARIGIVGERESGTLYTRHAGFVDLSHVRESIDWVQYFNQRIRAAIADSEHNGRSAPSFGFEFCEARFEFVVYRPEFWDDLAPVERQWLESELSIRAAQRLSIVVTTWHEIATWFGHQTLPGIPEFGSAFTWDDPTAHVVGAIVGGEALRDRDADWDQSATNALDRMLHKLGVVSPKEQDAAAEMVRDRWWKGWVAIRRDLDVGLTASVKIPWLVDEFGDSATVLEVPTLDHVGRYDLRGVISFTIVPADRIMRKLWVDQSEPHPLEGEQGLLDAVERVRASMREEFGEGFDRP